MLYNLDPFFNICKKLIFPFNTYTVSYKITISKGIKNNTCLIYTIYLFRLVVLIYLKKLPRLGAESVGLVGKNGAGNLPCLKC
jgi:hypothetical protein